MIKKYILKIVAAAMRDHEIIVEVRGKTIESLDRIADLERRNALLTYQIKTITQKNKESKHDN